MKKFTGKAPPVTAHADINGIAPYRVPPIMFDDMPYLFSLSGGAEYATDSRMNRITRSAESMDTDSDERNATKKDSSEKTYAAFTEISPDGMGLNGLLILSIPASNIWLNEFNPKTANESEIIVAASLPKAAGNDAGFMTRAAEIDVSDTRIRYWGTARLTKILSSFMLIFFLLNDYTFFGYGKWVYVSAVLRSSHLSYLQGAGRNLPYAQIVENYDAVYHKFFHPETGQGFRVFQNLGSHKHDCIRLL